MGCHHSKTHAVAAAASPSKRHPSPIRPGSNDDERRELAARSGGVVEPSRPAVPAKNDATSAAACSRGSIVGAPPDAPMDGDTVPQSAAATSGDDGGGGGARILLAAAYYANAEECVRAERMKRLAWEKLTARGGGASRTMESERARADAPAVAAAAVVTPPGSPGNEPESTTPSVGACDIESVDECLAKASGVVTPPGSPGGELVSPLTVCEDSAGACDDASGPSLTTSRPSHDDESNSDSIVDEGGADPDIDQTHDDLSPAQSSLPTKNVEIETALSGSAMYSCWTRPTVALNQLRLCARYAVHFFRASGAKSTPIFCAFLAFMLHAVTILSGEFVYDDRAAVLTNPDVTGEGGLLDLIAHDFWGQPLDHEQSHKSWRPVSVLSLRFSYAVYGSNARGFHFDNVVLHAIVTMLFATFCFRLTESCAKDKRTARAMATLASITFCVHPMHVEPVASIVGRADLLCALFYLAGIMLYRAGRKQMASLAGVLSTFSKENGVTAFGVYIACDGIMLLSKQRGSLLTIDKAQIRCFVRNATTNLAFAATLTAIHLSFHGGTKIPSWTLLENSISLQESRVERILSYSFVAAIYLLKLIFPWSSSYDYGWPCIAHVTSMTDPRNAGTLLAVTTILSLGMYGAKQRNAMMLWCLSMMILPFVPCSNLFFPVGTILAERLLYLPSMGFCLGVSYFLASKLMHSSEEGTDRNHSQLTKRLRGVVLIHVGVYLFWMAVKTIHRTSEWVSEPKLFESAMKVCRRPPCKVLNNQALRFLKSDPRHAITLLDEAIGLHEGYASAHFNRGIAHDNLGENEAAIESFAKSLALNPSDVRVRPLLGGVMLSHGKSLMQNGHADQAKLLLNEALRHVEDSLEGNAANARALHLRCELGNLLGEEGADVMGFCNAALDANRESASSDTAIEEDITLNILGIVSKQMSDHRAAISYFERAEGVNPESYDVITNLAAVHADVGNYDLAAAYFERAEGLSNDDPILRSFLLANRGWLMEKRGRRLAATQLYRRAIDLSRPNPHPQIVTNLRNINAYCEINPCD